MQMQSVPSAKCPFKLKPSLAESKVGLELTTSHRSWWQIQTLSMCHSSSLILEYYWTVFPASRIKLVQNYLKNMEARLITVSSLISPYSNPLSGRTWLSSGHQRSVYTPPGHGEWRKPGANKSARWKTERGGGEDQRGGWERSWKTR